MSNVISCVPTISGRDQVAKYLAGALAYFLIGEAGYTMSAGLKTAKTPDGTRSRLESQGTQLAGSFTFTNGSANVTATGAALTSSMAGQYIRPDSPIDGPWYKIQSVTDSNNCVLDTTYSGTTASGVVASSAPDAYYIFKKNFSGTDVQFGGAGTHDVNVTTFVDYGEANADQFGNSPEFFEIGLFDSTGAIIGYGTFPGETKTNLKTISNSLTITT